MAGPTSTSGINRSVSIDAGSSAKHSPEVMARLGRCSYRMVIAYDGTAYCGWQLQPKAPTIQRAIEAALSTALREDRIKLGVGAAGRTDAGVHANGQVVQFYSDRPDLAAPDDCDRMPYKLNSLLPHDVRVLSFSRTAPDFNVTVSATGKTYHYYIHNAPSHDPITHRFSMHLPNRPRALDVDAMHVASRLLVGTHDFTQLSNNGEDRRKRDPVKTLQRVDVVALDGALRRGALRIEVQGSGFLYKMVRHIVGVLVAVGQGRLSEAALARMVELGGSERPGQGGAHRGYDVAPAKGLFLHEVHYPAAVDDPTALLYPGLAHDEYGRLEGGVPGRTSDEDG